MNADLSNQEKNDLPAGQFEIETFPRFGLTQFAHRFPSETTRLVLRVAGAVATPMELGADLNALPRIEQISDFHCVTTWTKRRIQWSGYRFSDFYRTLVEPRARPNVGADFVVFRGQDGYRVGMRLEDLMASNVLLADQLEGAPLTIAHGAPLRLVAPAHYGYKNPKHLTQIEFHTAEGRYRRAAFKFMDHPRARVAFEERGRYYPGWLLRRLYRPLIKPTIRTFRNALANHNNNDGI